MKNTKKSDIFNLESKSNLAKLLATENIEVQINKVDTASFDVQNRILTLPKFKIKSQDVLDMLVGHECSHALHTDLEAWKNIGDDNKLRMACNVIEDARIDKLIQKKYPGLTKNYINGFDMMMKKDFFGVRDIDIQELSLIDKINLYFKSSKRLSFSLDDTEKTYFDKVDNVDTIEDVISLAKEIIAYQEEQNQNSEIPNFDSVEDSDDEDNQEADGDEQESDDGEPNENTESKNGSGAGDDSDENTESDTDINSTEENHGNEQLDEPFSITQDNYEKNVKSLSHDESAIGYEYLTLPKANLKNIIVDFKTHLSNFKIFEADRDTKTMLPGYQAEFKSFKKDNMKTVNYLVKEFEMKKSAEAYKRASTDKTGVLDPLKLKNYKFSDDIFKRLTVVPDAKNHGMIILVDWSGSMTDIAYNVVEQLSNLAWFCQRINIPYEIYLFSNANDYNGRRNSKFDGCFNHKIKDIYMEDFQLVNIASSKMKKSELDKSLMYLRMYCLLTDNYSSNAIDRKWFEYLSEDKSYSKWVDTYKMPKYLRMYSTPLNESLVACIDIIKKFKSDNKIEKMIFATITDGASNGNCNNYNPFYNDEGELRGLKQSNKNSIVVIKRNTKKYVSKINRYSSGYINTSVLLDIIKDECGTNNIGFFLQNKATRSEAYHYIAKMKRKSNESYYPESFEVNAVLKQYRKDKCLISSKDGYDSYYLVLGNTKVVNNNLSEINEDATKAQIRNHFKKSMTSRLNSRVLLNNFIEKIA